MFVAAELVLPLPMGVAREALARAAHDGGLVSASRRAVGDGLQFVMPVGPWGEHGPAKAVHVRLLPGRTVGDKFVMGMRWEVPGPSGKMFPSLDADMALSSSGAGQTLLSVAACYEPPLHRLGKTLDRALMSKVAARTMEALLTDVASRLHALAAAESESNTAPL
ncbi:MAG TPA: hypothetical protein VME46_00635 [Acidimicrobiales bacterium]|nr:hypothetical protein [Acidimicrobiales bacterium]